MTEKKKGKLKFGSTATNVILIFVIIIAVNIIAASLYFRWDITEENLYTLSEGTEKIVNGLERPITLKYYMTKNVSGLPMTYKNYGKKINELLIEYRNLNPEMINLEVYDPQPDSDAEVWAGKYGLKGIDLGTGERVYMGLVAVQEDNEVALPFMDPRREKFLEYDITQLIVQARQDRDKVIGVMSTLPVMGTQPNQMQMMQGQRGAPKWAFIEELEKTFRIEELQTDVRDIDDEIDILMVIHPKNLSESTQYAIDQFLLRGGELIVLVDPNSRSDQMAAMASRMGRMSMASSNLEKLFKHWGVQYQDSKIIGDLKHATRVNAGENIGVLSYSLWHSLDSSSFNQELIATKDLDSMLFVEPGGFTMEEDSPMKLNTLISTSKQSGLIDSYMTRIGDPVSINKKVVPDNKQYAMAGILNGKVTSAFAQRPEPPKEGAQENGGENDGQDDKNLKPHISESRESVKVLLITDTDFISDPFSVERFNLMGQIFMQPKNDNLNFMVNMVEFLGGAEALMQIRSRGRFNRPFTRFEELQQEAQAEYQEAEERLSAKLKEVQDKLSKLNVDEGTNKIVLTKEQIEKIEQFREEEKKTKSELREIRKLLREDIEYEKTVLTMLNLLIIPLILMITGLVLYYRRNRHNS